MDLCSQSQWQIQGETSHQRLYTSSRDRLWRNILSGGQIQINKISTAHAALLNWEIEAMDVKLAYLHRVLNEENYMEQLEGFIAKGEENKVCRLIRSLYGLKQAGRVWNRTFAHTIKKKLGFNTIHSDAGVYVLNHHHKRGDSRFENGYDPHFICWWFITLGKRPFQDWRHKTSTWQIVSNEGSRTCLILSGDSNYQRLKYSSHLDRSRGIYRKCPKEVWTSRCKQHKNPTPSWCTLGEIQGTSCPRHQDILPTDNRDADLCHNRHKTRYCICSNETITI